MHITKSRIWFRISESLPCLKNSKETSKNTCEISLKLKLVRCYFRIWHCKKATVISPNFLPKTFFGRAQILQARFRTNHQKLCENCTKFPHQDIRSYYGIFHSVANVAIMQWVTKTWTCYHTHYRMSYRTFSLKLAWFCAVSFVLGFYPLPLVIFYPSYI